MIRVYLEGHEYRNDLFELIRVFFPAREIEFVEESFTDGLNLDGSNLEAINLAYSDGLFIESLLESPEGVSLAISRVYRAGELIKEIIIDTDKIEIEGLPKRRIVKNAIKRSIYDALIDLVDFDVPWGILTGIRPIKVAHELLNNMDEDKAKQILMGEFRIRKDKADLMVDIAKVQLKYIYPLDRRKFSLYIHIPFCPSRCVYCSFPAFGIGKDYIRVEEYVDTLILELKTIAGMVMDLKLNTVYIGGGTPTSIKTRDLERIIASVRDNFKGHIKEFTVEAGRPDTLNEENLRMLRDMEVDRISINPQTMNLKTLIAIGRHHDVDSIRKSYALAKDLGFDINMDIIIGLPGEDLGDVEYSLEEIKKLDPENLTVHTLSLKRGSKLINKEELDLRSAEIHKMLDLTAKKAKEMGMSPYYLYRQKQILGNLENIGYAKVNKECIYNISMMEEKETTIGAGVGAVSKFFYPEENRIERLPNFRDLIVYSQRIDELLAKKREFIKSLY